MKILMLAWRDIKNPLKGGAEVLTHEMLKGWAAKGHEVTLFSSAFKDYKDREVIDGINIIRAGNRYSVYLQAYKFYNKEFKGKFDVIIDQVNTIPFFTPLFVKEKVIIYINQLAKEVWFYESTFPINILGYLLEPIYLKIYKKFKVITISESTKDDLIKLGFNSNNVKIIPMGISNKPLIGLPSKDEVPTFIYVGRITKSKRVHDIIKAFSLAKLSVQNAKLKIIGTWKDDYKKQLDKLISRDMIQDVEFLGFKSTIEKMESMSRAHAILVASIREGWGLIVTEANSMGTPAIVYNIHGLRDSTKDEVTGIVCKINTPQEMSKQMVRLITDDNIREYLSTNALEWSKDFNWERTSNEGLIILENFLNEQISL